MLPFPLRLALQHATTLQRLELLDCRSPRTCVLPALSALTSLRLVSAPVDMVCLDELPATLESLECDYQLGLGARGSLPCLVSLRVHDTPDLNIGDSSHYCFEYCSSVAFPKLRRLHLCTSRAGFVCALLCRLMQGALAALELVTADALSVSDAEVRAQLLARMQQVRAARPGIQLVLPVCSCPKGEE